MNLASATIGQPVIVDHVGGERAFRRRLMDLGWVPGTRVVLVGLAPLGDPMELLVRGASLSIRRGEAEHVRVISVEAAAIERDEAERTSEEAIADCAQSVP